MAEAKVLVVDDEDDVVQFIQNVLTTEGFDVVTAYDGLGAIDVAFAEKPDVILLDIMMPVMDGYEVCAKLRASEETNRIPILCLSSAYTTSAVRQSREMGAQGYIVKPFAPADLVSEIRRVLAEPSA
jgi:two-component system alkaline phosphatase synthesis response regulator PhoP